MAQDVPKAATKITQDSPKLFQDSSRQASPHTLQSSRDRGVCGVIESKTHDEDELTPTKWESRKAATTHLVAIMGAESNHLPMLPVSTQVLSQNMPHMQKQLKNGFKKVYLGTKPHILGF